MASTPPPEGLVHSKYCHVVVPILALPNELLYLVLTAVSQTEPPLGLYTKPSDNGHRRDQALGVLRLSEVCRRFRALLLSMSDMWASFAFELPVEAARLALSRSGSALVLAHIRKPTVLIEHGVNRTDLSTLAVEHAARIRVLTARELAFEQFRDIFRPQLPYLQRLDVSNESTQEHANEHVCIDAPELRSLQLAAQEPFLSLGATLALKLPSLTSLEWTFPVSFQDPMRILNCVADVLQGSPLIEHLKLELRGQEEKIHWAELFRGHDVKLKHLRSLSLEGSCAADLVDFYEHVCVHPPCKLLLTLFHPMNETEDVVGFVSRFSPLLQRPTHNGLRVTVIRHYSNDLLYIRTLPTSNDQACDPESVELQIILDDPGDGPPYQLIAQMFAAALSRNKVERLELYLQLPEVWAPVIQPIAAVCPDTTHLVLDHFKDRDCVLFASADIFSALITLQVQPSRTFTREGVFCIWWARLVAWLERREQAGNRVKFVRVVRPDWYKPDTEADDLEKEMFAQAAEHVEELTLRVTD